MGSARWFFEDIHRDSSSLGAVHAFYSAAARVPATADATVSRMGMAPGSRSVFEQYSGNQICTANEPFIISQHFQPQEPEAGVLNLSHH